MDLNLLEQNLKHHKAVTNSRKYETLDVTFCNASITAGKT